MSGLVHGAARASSRRTTGGFSAPKRAAGRPTTKGRKHGGRRSGKSGKDGLKRFKTRGDGMMPRLPVRCWMAGLMRRCSHAAMPCAHMRLLQGRWPASNATSCGGSHLRALAVHGISWKPIRWAVGTSGQHGGGDSMRGLSACAVRRPDKTRHGAGLSKVYLLPVFQLEKTRGRAGGVLREN